MRRATFTDLTTKKTAGYKLSPSEAAHLPKGSLFLDKKLRWLVTTTPAVSKIIEMVDGVYAFYKRVDLLKRIVGKENIMEVSFIGHRNSTWTTQKYLGEIPVVPVLMGHYGTVVGRGEEYSSSTVKVGDQFSHEGANYVCVHRRYRSGDAENFSSFSMLAVKLA